MKTIQIYDPAMCCSTGICGTDINPDLINFAAMLVQMKNHGIVVERYNLGQQALAFAQNDAVKQLLQQEGVDVLPLMFWDGELVLKGRYPSQEERREWVKAAVGVTE